MSRELDAQAVLVLTDFLRQAGVSRGRIVAALEALTARGAMLRRASREMRVSLRQLELLSDEGLISGAVVRMISADGLANLRGTGPSWAERRRFAIHVAEGHTPHCAQRSDCGSEGDLCALRKVRGLYPPVATASGFLDGVRSGEITAAGPNRPNLHRRLNPVSTDVDTAIGRDLEALALVIGFERGIGETDAALRQRVQNYDQREHAGEDGRCDLCGSLEVVGEFDDPGTRCADCLSDD